MSSDDSSTVLGIDLGTTFSAMAVVNNYGKPEIITNAEGFATTPSVVHFYDSEACVVGEEAVKMVVIDPESVVRFIKRHMGEEDFTLDFFGHNHTPQEISALILRKLKEDAEELLGETITDAVITVPAYFNSAQRGATSEAGTIAGLNVLSIINEPTAAAIAYGLDRIGEQRKLLVLDLGGGTFDVTCMEIEGTKLKTLASDGNAELGGKDWDDMLLNYVAEQFFEKFQLDPRDDASPYQELYERCLHAKISLSTKDRAVIPVNYRGQRMAVRCTREKFEELTLDLVQQCEDTANIVLEKANLTWDDLDDVLLVGGSTRMPMIRNMLTRLSGKEPATDVNPDECVALGAALAGVFRHRPRHPALQEKRQAISQRARAIKKKADPLDLPESPLDVPEGPLDPPEDGNPRQQQTDNRPKAAAIGMAYGGHVAAEMAGKLQAVEIEDATSHPLGIIVLDRNRIERVVELIPEGTAVPHEFRGRFAYAYENMTAVRVEVTEGSGHHRDEVTVLGKLELTGLPPRPQGTPIEIIYSYGIDQILKVAVIDVETGLRRDLDIRFQGGLSDSDMDKARQRNVGMSVE